MLALHLNASLSKSMNPYLPELKILLEAVKKALNALDVEIVAIPEEMKIRIAVPLEFITIEQTSA